MENLATAVVLLDEQSRIAFLNPAAEHLFEINHSNLLGQPLQAAFSHTEQLFGAMQSALANRASHIEHDLTLGTHTLGTSCTCAAP